MFHCTQVYVFTAVGVDEFGVDEAHFQVVQHGRFMKVTQSRQVILSHQDVRVPQVRQGFSLRVQLVLQILSHTQTGRVLGLPEFISKLRYKKALCFLPGYLNVL